ncbi:MAG: efflux RND transporter periplasmic adaptor subunit [Saprospiraceae bacterium]|nr:efflux RND transporter periplasmic adaptor subunit [Saprospiraceae bacterium]
MKSYFMLILAVLLAYSCGSNKEEAATSETETPIATLVSLDADQLKNAGITLGKPEMKSISATLKLNGSIDVPPQNMVSISFPLGGYLKSSKLLPGMRVRKGETLAVMEDAQFIQIQQDYLLAKSKMALAEGEFLRQQGLNADKASSDKVYQQAKNEFETQKIMVRALDEKLRLIGLNPSALSENNLSRSVSVRSPINGYVSKVNVNIGKYTAPTDVLFELVNPEDIHLALTVFEKDVAKLAIGQKVMAYTSDNPAKKYPAEILLISKSLDENRTAEVHCHFEKFDHSNLVPGMFMNADVDVKTEKALVVPEGAVVRWQNQNYVFVEAGNGAFNMAPVALGIAQDGQQQIIPTEDLGGKNVVLQNAYTLLMKLKNSAEE